MRYIANASTHHPSLPGSGPAGSAHAPGPLRGAHLHLMGSTPAPPHSRSKNESDCGTHPIATVQERKKAADSAHVARLRRTIAKLETSFFRAAPSFLSLGIPEVQRHLPGPGLACGVLHEVNAATYGDGPAALGFLFALTSLALKAKPGLAVLIASQRAFAQWGRPYGHGLYRFGVDPGRLMLVETGTDKEALWAIEETLRSGVRPAMVTGVLEHSFDLTASRRLNLAAAALATPLALASPGKAAVASAAATRWRIGALPASRDRFGLLLHPCWSLSLERCRHGRPGKWLVEWDHVTHCFSLVEIMADRSSAQGTGLGSVG
jgi:protein ImuA